MDFIELNTPEKWNALKEEQGTFIIFKHSYRCSLSAAALDRLRVANAKVPAYFVDVIDSRPISLEIEKHFGILHESPQFLVIQEGVCIDHDSHRSITVERFQSVLELAEVLS